jgi:ABC-type microcin C transport system permease subunit YejB
MLVANPLCWFCHDAAQISLKKSFFKITTMLQAINITHVPVALLGGLLNKLYMYMIDAKIGIILVVYKG